jgi:hypothetical protein
MSDRMREREGKREEKKKSIFKRENIEKEEK